MVIAKDPALTLLRDNEEERPRGTLPRLFPAPDPLDSIPTFSERGEYGGRRWSLDRHGFGTAWRWHAGRQDGIAADRDSAARAVWASFGADPVHGAAERLREMDADAILDLSLQLEADALAWRHEGARRENEQPGCMGAKDAFRRAEARERMRELALVIATAGER